MAAGACSLATAHALAAPVTIGYSGSLQTFTVETTGQYTITAAGAQGGGSGTLFGGGLGAQVFGDFWLTAGTVLNIVVGGSPFSDSLLSTGGGGGSFVYTQLSQLLLAAGGGGGMGLGAVGMDGQAGTSGSAGAGNRGGAGGTAGQGGAAGSNPSDPYANGGAGGGWLSDGAAGGGTGTSGGGRASDFAGGSYANGAGFGGGFDGYGGFGGGGGANVFGGGGGGGYSGGGAGSSNFGGGGGGSYIADAVQNSGGTSGARNGNGYVSFDLLPAAADPNAVPEPGSLLLAASALGALALLRRRRPCALPGPGAQQFHQPTRQRQP